MNRTTLGTRVMGSTLVLCALMAVASCEPRALTMADTEPSRAVAAPVPSHVLWSADHETGDLSQWESSDGGGAFNTGSGDVYVTNAVSRSGNHSLSLSIYGADGDVQGARVFRWKENPADAYYSAWLLFPEWYETGRWWDVFQFKSPDNRGRSQPMWVLNVGNRRNGEMGFYLWDALSRRSYEHEWGSPAIPVGKWIHVEVYYRRATDNSGRITVWQDGAKLFDQDGVRTAISKEIQWSLANYTDRITPSNATIYADDAVISTSRIGL